MLGEGDLGPAEVAVAEGHEGARVQRLLDEPVDRRGAVGELAAERVVEGALAAVGAAAGLDEDLEPLVRKEPADQQVEQEPAVGGADEHERGLVVGPAVGPLGCPVRRQGLDAVSAAGCAARSC